MNEAKQKELKKKKICRKEKNPEVAIGVLAVYMAYVSKAGIDETTVHLMRSVRWVRNRLHRYDEGGPSGLRDLPRNGKPRRIPCKAVDQIINKTVQSKCTPALAEEPDQIITLMPERQWDDGAASGPSGGAGRLPVSACRDSHAYLRWTVMVFFVPLAVGRRQIPHITPTCQDKGTLQFAYIDGKQPKVERCKVRTEGRVQDKPNMVYGFHQNRASEALSMRHEIPYDSTAEAGPEKYHIPYM